MSGPTDIFAAGLAVLASGTGTGSDAFSGNTTASLVGRPGKSSIKNSPASC